jgi:hypothetical protein
VGRALRSSFLGFPQVVQVRGFALELADFFFNQHKTFLRGFVFFAAHGFARAGCAADLAFARDLWVAAYTRAGGLS